MKSILIYLLTMLAIFLSSSALLAAATPGVPGSFGREDLSSGEIFLLLGVVMIFIAIKLFISSAWDAQDESNKNDSY
jgi:hypothetical protein